MMRRHLLCALLVLFCAAPVSAQAADAQGYPNKPIRFVIGPAPDLMPRLMAQKLAEIWKQQVVVDQRSGAGGVIAGETAAKAPPDGYTWLMSSASFVIIDQLFPKLPYSLARDFTPVTLMATLPWIAVVHPSVPARTPRAVIDKINSDINRLLQSPELKEKLLAAGFEPAQTTVEAFDAFVKMDVGRYTKVIRESNIRLD